MTVSVVFAIAGAIALLIGIVGGGIKAKEVEVPIIPTNVRIVTIVIGLILIGITLWLEFDKTSQTNPTPSTTPTIESTSIEATSTISQIVILEEDFSSNNIGWKEGSFSDQFADMSNEFINGYLRRTAIGKGDFIERVWIPNVILKNFQMSIDASVYDAPDDAFVCIGFRRSSDNGNFYHVYFAVNGVYGVRLIKEGNSKTVYEALLPNDIKIQEGVKNNFNITIQDSMIKIMVNDKLLTTLYDSGLNEAGNVGFGIGLSEEHETEQTIIVEFDNLVVWSMP